MLIDFRTSLSPGLGSWAVVVVEIERSVGIAGVDLVVTVTGGVIVLLDCEGARIASREGVCEPEGCRAIAENGIEPLRVLKPEVGGGIAERGVVLAD